MTAALTYKEVLQIVAGDSLATAREFLPGNHLEPAKVLPIAQALLLIGITLLEIHQGRGCGKAEATRLVSIYDSEAPR